MLCLTPASTTAVDGNAALAVQKSHRAGMSLAHSVTGSASNAWRWPFTCAEVTTNGRSHRAQTATAFSVSGPNAGRWNDVAAVTVTQTPAKVKIRWRRNSAQPGWIFVDGVRLLKIATSAKPERESADSLEEVSVAAPTEEKS
jgi:hypothetical protein